jgi:two-component system cell cycle response regulator
VAAAAVLVAAGVALARSRTERALRRTLVHLGEALAASAQPALVVQVVLETSREVTRADEALFWVDRGPVLQSRERRVARGEGVVGAAARAGEPTRRPPAAAAAGSEPPARSALAVPMHVGGRPYGVLSLHRRRPFSDAEVADVGALVAQAAAAVETSYRHDEARRLSLTDGLTGLWNRRQFELRAAQELERAARFGERFAVVLVDLDGFKAINDTHGHPVGDAVLVETAHRLSTHTREVDTVARYGGEEFVLLLPQTDADGAGQVAEKVRAELADQPVPTEAGPLTISLSAGVAAHPEHGVSVEALVAAADAALYAAKAAGKNRVVHADTDDRGATPR